MPTPEAFARVKIDNALQDSNWDLLDTTHVRLEATGRAGRSDYVLLDDLARPICVLEAKKEDEDPYDAKEQARGYAENVRAIVCTWASSPIVQTIAFTRIRAGAKVCILC